MEKMSVETLSKSYTEVSEAFKKFVKAMAEIRAKYSFLNTPVLRVFISVPMNGRTEEAIKADIEEAKAAFNKFFGLDFDGDQVEFVNTFIQNEAPDECRNDRIWYLGNSIKVLSTCDIILFARDWYRARGCEIEDHIASAYYIPSIRIYERRKEDKSDFEYVDGHLNLFVPDKEETDENFIKGRNEIDNYIRNKEEDHIGQR